MTHLASQSLSTSHYLDGEQTVCACCDLRYPGTGRHCQRCQAPLELSQTVQARGAPPQFVSVLGNSGSGKTVYLGMLMDMLSRGVEGLRGVAHGSHSVALQDRTISALERRRFPEKTAAEAAAWQWVHCEVIRHRRQRRPVDLITPDMAGEAITLELQEAGTYPAIQSVVSKSVGVLLLCDAISASRAPLTEDISALKLAAYVHRVQLTNKANCRKGRLKAPLAIILTKCDQCPEVEDDPHHFAENNLPRLVQFCQRGFSLYRFFAARVVSSSATSMDEYARCSELALHVEPRGIVEPLQWLIKP